MSIVLLESPRQLRWMLVRKLSTAALVIGLIAGGVSYQVETRRAEQAALEHAAKGARHFDSSIIQLIADAKATGKHVDLNRRWIEAGLSVEFVFGPDKALIYETWEDIPPILLTAVRSGKHQHDWPVGLLKPQELT
ncbi:MAG: hypothetical protein IPI44_09605 [Sulfuritalea sp.]|nr:hypothetical protein [Sulfuritalea sp.]